GVVQRVLPLLARPQVLAISVGIAVAGHVRTVGRLARDSLRRVPVEPRPHFLPKRDLFFRFLKIHDSLSPSLRLGPRARGAKLCRGWGEIPGPFAARDPDESAPLRCAHRSVHYSPPPRNE